MQLKFILILLFAASGLAAQTLSVTGRVVDEKGEGLVGATVALLRPDSSLVKGAGSDADGNFTLTDLSSGNYFLKINLLSYLESWRPLALDSQQLELGAIALYPNENVLGEVQVTGQTVTATQQQDTLQFNSGAYKVAKDADAQDLIEKMPSVTVENGQIKAQGENVQQVLVDGKPFFGNDPTAALKNVPAELIEKVQIFDAQSEQAQFTGFNDGNTNKTINIVTKSGMQNGQFGKVYAGYGYEDKYQAGGNINYFDGDRRISLIGMTNNINVQNFAAEDLLGALGGNRGGRGGGGQGGPGGMRGGQGGGPGGNRQGGGGAGDFLVGSSGGIATTHAVGLNYSDKWGKKVEVSGSYFFNNTLNETEELLNRQYIAGETFGQLYEESELSDRNNLNHRFNVRLEYQIDSSNSLFFRPRLTLQRNNGSSTTLGRTLLNDSGLLLNASNGGYASDLEAMNFSSSLLWRHKFAKKGRTVSLDLTSGYAPKRGESTLQSINAYYLESGAVVDSLNQRSVLDQNSWNAAANLEYTEPLGPNSQLLANYRYSYQQESSDRRTFDWAEAAGGYDALNEPLSNVFSNDYRTQQGGLGYNFSKGRALNFSARVNAQWADLLNRQTFPQEAAVDRTFFNILPSARLRFDVSRNRNVTFNYRANTQLPSVTQLQAVVDNSNPLNLTAGNPDILQAEQHNVFFNYRATNPAKSTVLFFLLGGGLTDNYIANSTYYAGFDHPIFQQLQAQPGAQLTIPVNLDGYRTVRSFGTYGFPVRFLKSNLNLDVAYNYARTPGLVNEQLNYATTNSVGAGVTLSSNISDKVDFTLSTRPMWNRSVNSLNAAANTEYLSQNSRARLTWQPFGGFVLRTDVTHTLYSGLSQGFNQNYVLWNAALGKKVLNDRGEIALAVNDILNQNRNISRTVTEAYIEDTRTNALTRFFMLSFTYNIRNFNTGKAPAARERNGGF
jgi:hypothetical protein